MHFHEQGKWLCGTTLQASGLSRRLSLVWMPYGMNVESMKHLVVQSTSQPNRHCYPRGDNRNRSRPKIVLSRPEALPPTRVAFLWRNPHVDALYIWHTVFWTIATKIDQAAVGGDGERCRVDPLRSPTGTCRLHMRRVS